MAQAHPSQPVLKPALDDNLPPLVNMTIEEWCTKFDDLSRQPDLIERDIFALTGRYHEHIGGGEVEERRMAFDATTCRLDNDVKLSAVCDIDSVLGIVAGQFPIADTATMKYFMLHDERYTLCANLHLPSVWLSGADGEDGEDEVSSLSFIFAFCTDVDGVVKEVKLHRIPNTRFATIGEFTVYLFLPELRHEADRNARGTNTNYVGQNYLQLLYDLAVRPAAIEVLPQDITLPWPAAYSSEMFRAAPGPGEGARLQASGREVHGGDVNAWINAIRRNIEENAELAFAQECFFLVEGKGLKYRNGVQHPPPSEPIADEDGNIIDQNNPRTAAVMAALADFTPEHFEPWAWCIDIATTFSASQGEGDDERPISLFINDAAHSAIMHHFTSLPTGVCERFIGARSGGYAKDEEAHLGNFAGFCFEPDEPADGVHYLQAYTSSKSVTYHLGRGRASKAKRTSPQQVLDDWQTHRTNHFVSLQEVFRKASSTHSVVVRFESRMLFEWYPHLHHEIGRRRLSNWFYVLRNTQYWGFKWRRLMAINNVLNRILTSDARRSLTMSQLPEVSTLVILLTWMANALVNRPDDGGTWDEIRDAGCVHCEIDGVVSPFRPQTIYFIHSLRLSRDKSLLPGISSHRTATRLTIVYLSCDTREGRTDLAVLKRFRGIMKQAPAISLPDDPWGVGSRNDPTTAGAPRRSNRQQCVTVLPADDLNDAFADVLPATRAAVRYASEELDPEERDEGLALSQQATNIVFAFPVQVFAKVPSARRGRSWCVLSENDLHNITFDVFCDRKKPKEIFTSYVDFGSERRRWDTTVNAWFPTVEEKAKMAKIQGLSQLSLWSDWETLLLDCDAKTSAKVVSTVRELMHSRCKWLPWMTKGKLWPTGRQTGGEGNGPWIIFNPRFRH